MHKFFYNGIVSLYVSVSVISSLPPFLPLSFFICLDFQPGISELLLLFF